MKKKGHTAEKIKRIDFDGRVKKKLLKYCRLKQGEIWEDKKSGHKVGVLDAASAEEVKKITGNNKFSLIINDPPYNVVAGSVNSKNLSKINLKKYIDFSLKWVKNAVLSMKSSSHLYVWLGADYRDNFQPLPDFMVMMRNVGGLKPKNFITMRNQRGYGTQKNWMWVRQELLHYVKGSPRFKVVYTDIPRILRGYYKEVGGELTENTQRSKSGTIRPGNVWVDIQQVFYRMEENVPGCYAQKPLKAIERIIKTSSRKGEIVGDFFSHSGTTLIAGERLKRKVYTFDIDPVFAEITIRRLENYRKTGKTGFQWETPFTEPAL